MIGIVYKFTIVAKYKMDGYKPFYVGQYSGECFHLYWGSGSIWNDFLDKLKSDFPSCWKKFVKREILYQGECNQKTLNKLEEIYIRRERALYSEGVGGCNVLPGAAIENNPAKMDCVREKMSRKKRELFSSERGEESRCKMREHHADFSGKNNPHYGSKWINNGVDVKMLPAGESIPEGWVYGNLRSKGENNPMYNIGENHPRYGKRLSEEEKEKWRGKNNPMFGKPSAFRGRKHTEEAKRILSEKALQRYSIEENHMRGVNSPNYGKKASEETKRKMSEAQRGRKHSLETKEKMRIAALKRYGKLENI